MPRDWPDPHDTRPEPLWLAWFGGVALAAAMLWNVWSALSAG